VNPLVSDVKFFWEIFVTLLVITDPPGIVPVFLGMTAARPKTERNRLAWQAALVALGVIVAFAVFGRSILDYLGVELPSLQAAGGLLLLLLIRFFRNEPAELGVRPLGAAPDAPIRPVQSGPLARVRTKVFLQQARRTFAFWNLIGIHYWGCAGHAIIVVYLADIIRAQGLSLATGALVVGTMFGVSSFTRFAVPIVADRMGSKGSMALCFFLQGLPIVLLFWAHEAWHFYLFAVLFGIGFGGEMSAFPIINYQYYGNAPTGTVYGWQMLGAGIGMASGAFLAGFCGTLWAIIPWYWPAPSPSA